MAATHQPASDEPLYEAGDLDAEFFWQRNRSKILLAVAIIVIAVVASVAYFVNESSKLSAAQNAFATAKSPEAWREVIAKYPGTEQAANATILLAESFREQGNIPQSTETFQGFIKDFPKHQLISGARLGIAENYALAGKPDEAVAAYRDVQTLDAGSYAAPVASLMEGRLLIQQGKLEEASKVFSTLLSTYSKSPAGRMAGIQLNEISLLIPAKTAPAP